MRQPMFYAGIVLLSIVLLSCGDDKDPAQLQADQINASINGVNQSIDGIIKAQCACSTTTSGQDLQTCIEDASGAPLELSECQKVAAACDINSYIASMNCLRDAYKTLTTCISSCPNSTMHAQCIKTFETNEENCNPLFTAELETAFQSCQSNQTPACANSPTPDPKPGNNQCISLDDFHNRIVGDSWLSAYFAGSDGLLKCENGKACLYEFIALFADQTYHYSLMNQGRFGDTSAGSSYTVCTHGTWNLQCDKLTLTDCNGETTTTIRLTNEGFQLDSRSFKHAGFMPDVFSGWDCSTRPCHP